MEQQNRSRASYSECALMSCAQYPSNLFNEEIQSKGWIIRGTKADENCKFFATIYSHEGRRQVVVAYRGTKSLTALKQGYKEIWQGKLGEQKRNSFLLIPEAIEIAKSLGSGTRITFTGHSLGGFLSVITLFFATDQKYVNVRMNSSTTETATEDFPHLSCVAFESPGQLESLQELQGTLEQFHVDSVQGLDITSFVSYPNCINTIGTHVGTLIMMDLDLPIPEECPNLLKKIINAIKATYDYTNESHSSQAILKWLKNYEEKGDGNPKFVKSWPKWINTKHFFECYEQTSEGKYELTGINENDWINLCYKNNFQLLEPTTMKNLKLNQMLPLRNFDKELQNFLEEFVKMKKRTLANIPGPADIQKFLKDYYLESFGDVSKFVIFEGDGGIVQFRDQVSHWHKFEDGDKYLENTPVPFPVLVAGKIRASVFGEGTSLSVSGGTAIVEGNTSCGVRIKGLPKKSLPFIEKNLMNKDISATIMSGTPEVKNGGKLIMKKNEASALDIELEGYSSDDE